MSINLKFIAVCWFEIVCFACLQSLSDGCISPTPTGGDLSIHNASSASIQTGAGGGSGGGVGALAGVGSGDGAGAPSSATSSLISSVTSGQMPDSLKGGELICLSVTCAQCYIFLVCTCSFFWFSKNIFALWPGKISRILRCQNWMETIFIFFKSL